MKLFATVLLALALPLAATPASATTRLIDDYGAPENPTVSIVNGLGQDSFSQFTDSVPGGVRGVTHNSYVNPLGTTSTLAVGAGVVDSQVGSGARTEVLLAYGAFTRPTGDPLIAGPLLRMDVRPYDSFQLDFAQASTTLNINVVMYTSRPLDLDNPRYYTTAGLSFAPAAPGGPLQALLGFNPADAATFNYGHVDGILVLINRANAETGVAFTLDSFSLVSAVPEPGTWAMWLAGLAAVGGLARRRAVR